MRSVISVTLLFAGLATAQMATADSRVGISLSLPPFDHIYYSSGDHYGNRYYAQRNHQWRHSENYRHGYQGYQQRRYPHGYDLRHDSRHGHGHHKRAGRAPIYRSFSHICR